VTVRTLRAIVAEMSTWNWALIFLHVVYFVLVYIKGCTEKE
jgi:hypothetical protein